jgi:hypothetical protein
LRALHRIGTWLGVNAWFLKPLLVPIAVYLDDKLGYGRRNPAKKWWLDLEVVDGICQEPRKGSNERELDIEREIRFDTHKVAYYPARVAPDPTVEGSQPLDRKAALAEVVETPEHAYARTHAASKQRA